MRKYLIYIGSIIGLVFLFGGVVFANEQTVDVSSNVEETSNEFLHFTPETVGNLSEKEVDFVNKAKLEPGVHKQGTLYVISLGAKPNPGYGLEFIKSETTWEQEKIYVKQIFPNPNLMYPQVISYPYIVGRLQLPTKYMTLNVMDSESGKALFVNENIDRRNEEYGIKVYINGKLQSFDQPPVLKDGRIMVPLRGIFELLGSEVKYQKETGKITVIKGKLQIVLNIHSNTITINGQIKTIDTPAIVHNNRTLIPLRLIGESLGAKVSWDAKQKAVYIDQK